jgi:hypothetical protein
MHVINTQSEEERRREEKGNSNWPCIALQSLPSNPQYSGCRDSFAPEKTNSESAKAGMKE